MVRFGHVARLPDYRWRHGYMDFCPCAGHVQVFPLVEGARNQRFLLGEKIQNGSHGGRDSAKVFDQECFAERLLDQLEHYYSLEGVELETVKAAVKEEILGREDGNGPYALMNAAAEFTCILPDRDGRESLKSREFRFDPYELPDGKEYSYHFIWCLYAIVWGVQQYDAIAAAPATESREPSHAS